MTIENLQNLKDRVADLSTLTDQLQRMIDITQRTQELTRQLTDATHDMNAHTRQMRDNANELRDRIADFDDFWRPLRSFTYWETPARYIASARRTGNCNGYQFLLGHCVWRSATGLAGHRGPPADPHGPPAC